MHLSIYHSYTPYTILFTNFYSNSILSYPHTYTYIYSFPYTILFFIYMLNSTNTKIQNETLLNAIEIKEHWALKSFTKSEKSLENSLFGNFVQSFRSRWSAKQLIKKVYFSFYFGNLFCFAFLNSLRALAASSGRERQFNQVAKQTSWQLKAKREINVKQCRNSF